MFENKSKKNKQNQNIFESCFILVCYNSSTTTMTMITEQKKIERRQKINLFKFNAHTRTHSSEETHNLQILAEYLSSISCHLSIYCDRMIHFNGVWWKIAAAIKFHNTYGRLLNTFVLYLFWRHCDYTLDFHCHIMAVSINY